MTTASALAAAAAAIVGRGLSSSFGFVPTIPYHVNAAGRVNRGPVALYAVSLEQALQQPPKKKLVEEVFEEDSDWLIEAKASDLAMPPSIGTVRYFGTSVVDGMEIWADEECQEATGRLMPADVVAAEVPEGGSAGRLLDGRGWIQLGLGLEEVHPWAAQIFKKPKITRSDPAALAYLSFDEDELTPLAQHLPLPQRVIHVLGKRGIAKASPIQEAVFSRVHRGESMCLQSQTGTGKTLAMMLPLLTAMSEESEWGPNGDKVIVVVSCRELAVQLMADIDSMGFYPKARGYTTMVIVGNVPPTDAVLQANVIIGTPNELGGVLHKDTEIITNLNTHLRAIVLDEVDAYTTAPNLYATKWSIKRRRKLYNEQKVLTNAKLGDFDTGKIEWFMKRMLAYSRRRDLQVLAASATMNRLMARKVYRLLRWDPLGRWYNKPPPLLRPLATMAADWQAIPRMPTLPLAIKHRYVPVIKSVTDTEILDSHFTRRGYGEGGLPRLKINAATGRKKDSGLRPFSKDMSASMLDGLYDTLKSRKPGSSMVIICRSMGVTVRDTVKQLHEWGLWEAQGLHEALWEDPVDWPSRWAVLYTYDQKDHSPEIAARHQILNNRMRNAEHVTYPKGSPEWKTLEQREAQGETTSPILVGFEGIGRGIHFDGVETVYIVGIPRKPEIYFHLAGRVGRLGQKGGTVVNIVPKRATKVLDAWARQIGPGVRFKKQFIRRFRSADVDRDAEPDQERQAQRELMYEKRAERRRLEDEARREKLTPWEERQERDRQRALKAAAERPLLGEGQEPVYFPGKQKQDSEPSREKEPVLTRKEEVAARRAAARIARSTRYF